MGTYWFGFLCGRDQILKYFFGKLQFQWVDTLISNECIAVAMGQGSTNTGCDVTLAPNFAVSQQ
jgi:hypothetical protein